MVVFYCHWGALAPVLHSCLSTLVPSLVAMECFNCCVNCRAPLEPEDGHRECPSCLGLEHLQQGLTDMACADCMCLSVAARTSRLAQVGPPQDASLVPGGQGAVPATTAMPRRCHGVATRPTFKARKRRLGRWELKVSKMSADFEEMKAL